MVSERYSAEAIAGLLRREKIASMPELMAALGTQVERTVFRKLSELPYQTSYSHRGCFYTLLDVAEFDHLGLWGWKSVWFSRQGTLVETAAAFVECASAGYLVEELDDLVHVGTKDVLRTLVEKGRLSRAKYGGQYLYCSGDPGRARLQREERAERPGGRVPLELMPEELKAAIVLFLGLLDEKQRRLYAGLESLKTGWGGDHQIAQLLGVDPGTVARGRRELLERDVEMERVRRIGGGRKPTEKKRPRSSPASKS
jgi:hypothetical protein